MSHLIETAVFSAREGAGWTGLGQEIPAAIASDPRKIAEHCKALYTVSKRECFFKNADGTLTQAIGREVLVRDDTNAMLEVVSDNRYHIENRQPVDIFEAFRDELAAQKLEISHAAVLAGGSKIAVCAYLPHEITVGKSDRVKTYVTLSTGYDGKHGTKASLGTERVVCANTLAMSIAQATAAGQLKTIKASQILTDTSLPELVKIVQGLVAKESETFGALAKIQMTSDAVAAYFTAVLSGHIERIDKSKAVSTKTQNILSALASAYNSAPGAGLASGTAWGALNAVTYYATHIKTVRDTSGAGTAAARVSSNLDGDAARMKLRALALASQLVAA